MGKCGGDRSSTGRFSNVPCVVYLRLIDGVAPHDVDVLGVLAGATKTETMLDQKPEAFADAMDPAEVARGALDHLGKGPNWIPGEANQGVAKGLWPVPRIGVVNAMTQASADLFDLPFTPAEGVEFDD